jgi:outer membrane protein
MQKIGAYAGVAPRLNIQSSVSRSNGNNFNANLGSVVNGTFDAFNVSGSVQMNLFSGFSQINSIRQFSKALEAQTYFVNRTAQDAINTVATQYLLVMRDVELHKIATRNFEALTKQLEQVKEMVAVGSRSQVEEYNQDALTKAAELRMVQAEINLNNDKATLAQTLLIDAFEEFTTEAPNWDANVIGGEVLNVQELANRAKQNRGDYLRAVKAAESSRFGLAAARGQYFPSLGAFYNLSTRWNFDYTQPRQVDSSGFIVENRFYPRPFDDQVFTNNVSKSYGLQLTIPIFNGFQQRTQVVQQRVFHENNELFRNNLEFQIKNDVLRTVRNYEGAKKAFSVASARLTAAELAYEFETERYNLGVTNFVDFTNANTVLVQAQTDKAQSEYTLVFQKILLEYAVGTLKPEDISATSNK